MDKKWPFTPQKGIFLKFYQLVQAWKFVKSMETICRYRSLKFVEMMEQFFVYATQYLRKRYCNNGKNHQ